MSLTMEQKKNTIKELKQNLEISGLTLGEIANDLGTDEMRIKMNYKNNRFDIYKIGLGCVVMKNLYNKEENIKIIHTALDS